MEINVLKAVKFEGVHYQAGKQKVSEEIAIKLVDAGFAETVKAKK